MGSSVLSFSDILNNHKILVGANVFGSLTDANLLVQYTNLTRRVNWSVAAFQYSYDLFRGYQSPWVSQVTTQINRGVQFYLSRPSASSTGSNWGYRASTVPVNWWTSVSITSASGVRGGEPGKRQLHPAHRRPGHGSHAVRVDRPDRRRAGPRRSDADVR